MIEQLHGMYGTVYLQTVAMKEMRGSKTLIRRIAENIVEYISECLSRKPRISEQIKYCSFLNKGKKCLYTDI